MFMPCWNKNGVKECKWLKRVRKNPDLVTGNIPGLVITDKRPLQNGDRAGQHSFFRFLRMRLCIF